MAEARLNREVLVVDGVALWIEAVTTLATFEDDDGAEYEAPYKRDAAVSILWPHRVSWADVLDSPQFDAALAVIVEGWGTSRIDVVHEGDRDASAEGRVTSRHPDGAGCVDVIVFRALELV